MNISTPIAISCPLCHSNDVEILDTLKSIDLVDLYQAKLALDISRYVTSDIRYLHCKRCDLGFFDPCPMGDAEFYETLQANPWYYMDEKPEYNLALDFITRHVKGSVLEIGGGSGQFARKIAGDVHYTGLEFNELAINKARIAGIQMHRLDLTQYIQMHGNKHDCVISFQVLEHVTRPDEFIRDSLVCLKKNGYLIVSIPNNNGVGGLLPNIPLDLPPHHATHWSKDTLINLGQQFDLEIVNIFEERVAPQHKIAAKKYRILQALAPNLIAEAKLLQSSSFYNLCDKLAAIGSRMIPINVDSINGHTISAIFRKKN